MNRSRLAQQLLLSCLFFLCCSINLDAQKTQVSKDSIMPGDDILFLEGLETANRSVIDTTMKDIIYHYVNEDGEVRDSSIARHLIVKAYKNVKGRRRLDTFKKGTKVRWKRYGKFNYGYVELYSGAKENVDITLYSDTLISLVEIPAQYISPIYGAPDRIDTLKLLNQIWEADEALFMFPIKDSIEYCYPLLEDIVLTPTYREKDVQFIFTNLKFAMLMKDDLQTGIVGSWQIKGDEIHVTTQIASLPEDADGNKSRLRCSDTYVYNWRLRDEGNRLELSHVGPLPYVPEVIEPVEEIVEEQEDEIDDRIPAEDNPIIETRPNKPKTNKGKLHPFWWDKY